MNKLLLTLLIGTSLSLTAPAFAHGDEDHPPEAHEATTPIAGDSFSELEKTYAAIEAHVTAGSLDKIHATAEGMKVPLQSLKDTHRENSGITGTIDMITKTLDDLHVATDDKNTPEVQKDLKKLESGLKLLKARLQS